MIGYMNGGPGFVNPIGLFAWIAAIGLGWAYAICYYGAM